MLSGLPQHVKVVDLSADFRLRNVDTYATWYGGEHKAPELQKEAVYGLTELHREAVAGARLVANPGCYPTCAQLPLVPLLRAGAISAEGILIDAKSGVSGAGRAAKEANLFCEVADGMHSYGVGSHRHMPEIEQGLSDAAGGSEVTVSFTPHLIPMSRGMLNTMYVQLSDGRTADDLRGILEEAYKDEYFVRCDAVLRLAMLRAAEHRGECPCAVYHTAFAHALRRALAPCGVVSSAAGARGRSRVRAEAHRGLQGATKGRRAAHAPRARLKLQSDQRLRGPHPRARDCAVGDRQRLQGRLGPGDPEPQRYDGLR